MNRRCLRYPCVARAGCLRPRRGGFHSKSRDGDALACGKGLDHGRERGPTAAAAWALVMDAAVARRAFGFDWFSSRSSGRQRGGRPGSGRPRESIVGGRASAPSLRPCIERLVLVTSRKASTSRLNVAPTGSAQMKVSSRSTVAMRGVRPRASVAPRLESATESRPKRRALMPRRWQYAAMMQRKDKVASGAVMTGDPGCRANATEAFRFASFLCLVPCVQAIPCDGLRPRALTADGRHRACFQPGLHFGILKALPFGKTSAFGGISRNDVRDSDELRHLSTRRPGTTSPASLPSDR